MKPIEIRLDPAMVESLLETIGPALESLEDELATPAEFPEDDELMENFWKSDLLESQREELAVIAQLFDEEFLESGRAIIAPEDMEKVIRACSAIRLKLRSTLLGPLSDAQLEEGDLEGVEWSDALQIGYAAYALFASLQELIVSQMSGGPMEDDLDWDGEDGSR